MKSQNLTPSQVADMLGVSPTTVRLWSTQFADHLSAAARPERGKRRSYTADDLAVLQRAHMALRDGKTVPEVAALLSAAPVSSGVALVTTGAIVGELNATRATLAAMRDEWRAQQEQQTASIQTLADEVQALRGEVEALKARGFWARLLNRPGKP
jgi:DNA-binding transcriptional MerR regulator